MRAVVRIGIVSVSLAVAVAFSRAADPPAAAFEDPAAPALIAQQTPPVPPPPTPPPPTPPPQPPAAPVETAPAPQSSIGQRIFYGGTVGASFGDVDYIAITPTIGYLFTPKVSGGAALNYAYRNDSRYTPELSTSDYGFELFGRYRVLPSLFLEGRVSWWSYEVPLVFGGTERDSYTGTLAGVGYVMPLGGRAAFVASALYDFNYSDNDPSPYDSPWVVSLGVTFGF